MSKIIIGLGANLGDRLKTLNSAILALESNIGKVTARSDWFETEALLPDHSVYPQPNYPSFLNGVAILESNELPQVVLNKLNQIENMLGRVRANEFARWAPRIIDLDIIGIDDLIYHSDSLKIPHPEMHKRKFVLEPLASIWPDWVHPILLMSCVELLHHWE